MKVESDSPLLLIVGAQRSGTTMLRLMLNSHPELAVLFESDFLAPLGRGVGKTPFRSRLEAERAVTALAEERLSAKSGLIVDPGRILAEQPRDYSEVFRIATAQFAQSKGKSLCGVKTPGYNARLDELIELLPDAKFVHIVRDGRDVAVSLRSVSWGSRHMPRIARDWRWKVMLGHKCGRMLPRQYHELRYEDLVRSPEATLRTLCAFIGVTFDSAMLDYHLRGREEMPASSLQWHESSVSAPDTGKIGEWRRQLPLADVLLFQEEAGDALSAFGYELEPPRARVAVAVRRAYYTLAHRW